MWAFGKLSVFVSTWWMVKRRGPCEPVDPTNTFHHLKSLFKPYNVNSYITNTTHTTDHSHLQWCPNCSLMICQKMMLLPCSALKPCSGTRELPVTNCSSRALCSSSYSSTMRQNQRTTFVSSEQCFNRVFLFQSSMSILPSPPIISCTTVQTATQYGTVVFNS